VTTRSETLVGLEANSGTLDLDGYDSLTVTVEGAQEKASFIVKWSSDGVNWPKRITRKIDAYSKHVYRLPIRERYCSLCLEEA